MQENVSWLPSVTNLTSVIVALISVGLGYVMNAKASQRQRDNDERRQNKMLLMQKGEELHQLVSEWSKFVNSHNLLRMSIAEGKISFEQMNDMLDIKNIGRVHDRLDTILRIYFPSLVPNLELTKIEIDKVNSFFNQNGYGGGPVTPDVRNHALQAAKNLEQLQKELQMQMSTLIN